MGVACLEFRGENFRGWRKNREIRESFLSRKFPAIRYMISFYNCGIYALTYSMVSEAVELLHHNLFENVQIGDQNVGLLTDIKSTLLCNNKINIHNIVSLSLSLIIFIP